VIFDSNGKTRIDDDRLLKLLLRTILSDFTAKFPEAFLIVRDDIKPQIASCSKAPPGSVAERFTNKHQVCNRCFFRKQTSHRWSNDWMPQGSCEKDWKESMNSYRLWEVLEGGARSVSVPWPTVQKFCCSSANESIQNNRPFIYLYIICITNPWVSLATLGKVWWDNFVVLDFSHLRRSQRKCSSWLVLYLE